MYVRPKILQRDREACDHIIKKLEEEKVVEAIQKQWYVQERHETRARLMRQKERNIKAEVRSGVTKSYLPVGLSLAVHDSMQGNNNAPIRLSMATVSNQVSNALKEDETI